MAGTTSLRLRQRKLLKVFMSVTCSAALTFTVAGENQPGNSSSTPPLRHKALVILVRCQFSRLSKILPHFCSGLFFSLHCGLGVRSEPAEVFDGAQTSGASIYAAHSSVNIPICMFGCPRKATKKWNAAVPKISNSIYGFWPVPSLKAELERCLSTLRRKLSSCLEKRRPGLFISPSCAVSPL